MDEMDEIKDAARRRAEQAADTLRDSGMDVITWARDNKLDAAVAFVVVFALGAGVVSLL